MARNSFLHPTVSSSVAWGSRAIFPSAPACGRAFYSQAGFSLLELLLVLFILGLMATSAVLMTQGVEDQSKYDETKRRMELIKRAIVGDSTRTVNGGPENSGFVADMGRLPGCMAELITPGEEKTPNTIPKTFDSPCGGSVVVTAWHLDAASGLWSGWRGPYIDTLPDTADGERRFRDGYGNQVDDENFGWSYTAASGVASLSSLGQDGQPGNDDVTDTALLIEDDYRMNLTTGAIRLNIRNLTGAALTAPGQNLKLRLYYVNDGVVATADTNAIPEAAISGVPAGDALELAPDFASSMKPSAGVVGYVLLCADDTLYEGTTCSGSPGSGDVELFKLPSRAALPIFLDWTVE